MNFKSDNTACIHPKILEYIEKSNIGYASSYGADEETKKLQNLLNDFFETEVSFYTTSTGSAANSLALSALTPPYGLVYCAAESHMQKEEAGAPELFTGGAKLYPSGNEQGKLDIDIAQNHVEHALAFKPHAQKPSAISLSSPNEWGLAYSIDELQAIAAFGQRHSLPIHLDGARFANALVALNASPADLTWKNGIDVLSFGATKNGAMAAEMVVFFNDKYTEEFDYRHKRGGQLFSKNRFFAAQWLAYLEEDVWKSNATHANNQAQKLADLFRKSDKTKLVFEPDVNILFVEMEKSNADQLVANGAGFYPWIENSYRFVTNWQTTDQEIEEFSLLLNNL